MNETWEHSLVREAGTFFKCQKCDTKTRLYNESKAVIFTCPQCGKIYSKDNPKYDALKPLYVNKHVYATTLYSKCEFDNVEYTLIGVARKHEKGDQYGKWQEYVLIDNTGHYAFLNMSYGHWTFLKERNKPVEFDERSNQSFINDDGREYTLFSAFYQLTDSCIGEFPYDVIDVKSRFSKEFISPPFMFSYEHCKEEKSYFEGIYVNPKEVDKAFHNKNITLPQREGTGSCQPSYLGFNHVNFLKLTIALFLVGLACFKILTSEQEPLNLAATNVDLVDSIRTAKSVTPSFILPLNTLLRCDTRVNIDNDWMELNITLVNEKTGEEKNFVVGHEYYSGYDDGYWAEGSVAATTYLNGIAPGTYHAEVEAIGSDKRTHRSAQAAFILDHPSSWNFWLLAAFLGGIAILVFYLGDKFEKQRVGFIQKQ
jgi:predicted RNA-binding Zn-ribbon protein involved in translation (DUF1610 family)